MKPKTLSFLVILNLVLIAGLGVAILVVATNGDSQVGASEPPNSLSSAFQTKPQIACVQRQAGPVCSKDGRNWLRWPFSIADGHPRRDGKILQYRNLGTALGEKVVVADVLDSSSKWFNWRHKRIRRHGAPDLDDYANTHNHYQALASEVINFIPWANAVGVWGDSWAANNKSRAWGALFTARADCNKNWAYNPTRPAVNCRDFDSQLVGVEVDVINLAKPGTPGNEGKTGVQVVGFGRENTMAFEARTATPGEGRFTIGMNFADAITSDGSLIATWQESMGRGLELSNTDFKNGVIGYKSNGVGSGFVANEGRGGQIYSEGASELGDYFVINSGSAGLKIRSNDSSRDILRIDASGAIHLLGDVHVQRDLFVKGERLR